MTSPPAGDDPAVPVALPPRGRWRRLRAVRGWCRDVSRNYGAALCESVILQVLIILLAGMIMTDGPLEFSLLPLTPYWAGTIMIIARRPASPTKVDVDLVRWGYLLLLGLFVPLQVIAGLIYMLIHPHGGQWG